MGYYLEYKKADDEYDKIAQEVVKTKGKERIIDFERLRKINPDTIGWVYAKGTNIDYPVVLGKDNDYYLHTTFEGTKTAPEQSLWTATGIRISARSTILYTGTI